MKTTLVFVAVAALGRLEPGPGQRLRHQRNAGGYCRSADPDKRRNAAPRLAGDEVYGGHPGLRGWLEGKGIAYVTAIACSEMITVPAGRFRADELAALVPASGWQRLSGADGSKGPRLYGWALIGTANPGHQVLVRRSLADMKIQVEDRFFAGGEPGGDHRGVQGGQERALVIVG